MGKFLTRILAGHRGDDLEAGREGDHSMKIVVALMGLLCVCGVAVMTANDSWEAAYRVSWLLASSVVLWIIGNVTRLSSGCSSRELGVAFAMVIVQMLVLWVIFSVFSLVVEHVNVPIQHRQLLLVIPYMLAPVTVTVLTGSSLGMFTVLACSFFGLAMFPESCPNEVAGNYLIISLLAGVVSTRYARYEKRVEPLIGGLITGGIVFVTALALNTFRLDGHALSFNALLVSLLVAMGVNLTTVILFAGAVPVLENLSNLFTPMTWRERAAGNHPLLLQLKQKAPGTFAHCQEVKILAEAAAVALDADDDLVGACALFHDIGKLSKPEYFSENMPDQTDTPHKALTPEASARIILGHVDEGVRLAQEYGLESRIIDAIREHHGKSNVYFFYRKAMDQYEESLQKFNAGLTDTEPQPVDISNFTYKGPSPRSRETAIVSMADAVESATRSLNHASLDDYRNMIENIFRARILDGHLRDSGLTLGDLEVMKDAFVAAICASHHSRIQYPKAAE